MWPCVSSKNTTTLLLLLSRAARGKRQEARTPSHSIPVAIATKIVKSKVRYGNGVWIRGWESGRVRVDEVGEGRSGKDDGARTCLWC